MFQKKKTNPKWLNNICQSSAALKGSPSPWPSPPQVTAARSDTHVGWQRRSWPGCIFSSCLCSVDSHASLAAHEVSRRWRPAAFGRGPSCQGPLCAFRPQSHRLSRGARLAQGPRPGSALPRRQQRQQRLPGSDPRVCSHLSPF